METGGGAMADRRPIQLDLQGFLKWYQHYREQPRPNQMQYLKSVLDVLVPGDSTEQEKLQFIRDEIAAGRRMVSDDTDLLAFLTLTM
jgi:hypothetical protein